MSDTTNDIYDLLSLLERGGWERYRATAAALVAERDALLAERNALKDRVAELEAQPLGYCSFLDTEEAVLERLAKEGGGA